MAEPFTSQDIRTQEHGYGEIAEQPEGDFGRPIERQASKVPSDLLLWGAGAVTLGAIVLRVLGRRDTSALISQIAPMFLILGLYNRLVKVADFDRARSSY